MRFINPIPFVHDIDRSKAFYRDVIGLGIVGDFGNFVLFESGFAIHDGHSLEKTIWRKPSDTREAYGRRNLLLYFEDNNIAAAFGRIAPQVELIHAIEQQAWGQSVFRFYDPDGHVVEIGEPQDLGLPDNVPEAEN